MKLAELMKMSPLDIGLLVVFIIYIIFPIGTPEFLAHFVSTPLGLVALFIVSISLFAYTNPVIAVVFVYVAYEMIRRSGASRKYDGVPMIRLSKDDEYEPSRIGGSPEVQRRPIKHPRPSGSGVRIPDAVVGTLPEKTKLMSTRLPHELPESGQQRNMDLDNMNPPRQVTLEEEIVGQFAPIGVSSPVSYHDSDFKPMVEKVAGASVYR